MFPGESPLFTLAVVLIAGTVGGRLTKRFGMPSVTGQILAGVLIGHSGLALFHDEVVMGLAPITHFALGLIAVTVGTHLNIARLRNAIGRLSWMVACEALIIPALVVSVALAVPGTSWQLALLLGTLAISTAPATIVSIVKETHSRGVFVKTLVGAVALNNIACIFLFEVGRAIVGVSLHPELGQTGMWPLLGDPLLHLLEAAVIGSGVGAALVALTWNTVRVDHLATKSMIAILLTAGLAAVFHLSSLLACMFLGIVLANLTPDREELGDAAFENFETAIHTAFFTLAGMSLHFEHAVAAGLLATLMVLARIVGKLVAGNLAMRIAGATDNVRRYLGPALIPQAGVAVGLILVVYQDPAFEEIAQMLLAVGLTVVTANEIVGPLLTRVALGRSGDLGKDRDRLIDFLHEENISVDLVADTKEECIEKLADLLITSNHLKMDRQTVIEKVQGRQDDILDCVGGGLAVPHCRIEEGTLVGAMGISQEGLPFETPDGVPVHCVLLVVTPESKKDRHLEVLAAFARAIGHDIHIQRQLFHAKSPAHVYDLLHADETAADFNYFLTDDE